LFKKSILLLFKKKMKLLSLLQLVWIVIHGEIPEHRIEELPGYGKIHSEHYSGYIGVELPHDPGNTAYIHYW